ncbi:STAS domain-containing protein [Novosphingopyxis sp. YJ-S2-01]|uniref:STAS domain-containing protein n=1 Tax=Novosphingopyxis sp. YJ-S2-01 TaxID=2794021 RepID=UPI0018DC5232|nr:STAS domain-containing protein [Novosphingopyxis sp. YJ-S2-01]MBH9538560.1 STAS domain-containing protein [Novosphingopyxis sp. YJ-S2-01]
MNQLLPATLNSAASGLLRCNLRQAIGNAQPVILLADQVEQIGLAGLQVLLAARKAAGDARVEFRIDQPSDAMVNMVKLSGLDVLLEPAEEGASA